LDENGVPELHLTPANQSEIKELQVYQCLKTSNNIARFWRDVDSVRQGNTWVAKLPVMNVNDYVFSYANIHYKNDCVLSSDFEAVIPSKLGKAVATDKKSDLISGGTGQWSHVGPAEGVGGVQGFRPLDNRRGTRNIQFSDPKWKAPKGSKLSFRFYCTQPQKVVLSANRHFTTELEITASNDWQSMTLTAKQLLSHGVGLSDWSVADSIGIMPATGSDITKVICAEFKWVE
jgi:hypothetical protein